MSPDVQSSPVRVLLVCGLIAVSSLSTLGQGTAKQAVDNPATTRAQLAENYGKFPLSFEANQGQADKTAKFLSNGSGYSLFLTDRSAVLALTKPEVSNAKVGLAAGKGLKPASARPARKTDVVRMELAGANRAMQVTGVDQLPGTANYFIGNDPSKWPVSYTHLATKACWLRRSMDSRWRRIPWRDS